MPVRTCTRTCTYKEEGTGFRNNNKITLITTKELLPTPIVIAQGEKHHTTSHDAICVKHAQETGQIIGLNRPHSGMTCLRTSYNVLWVSIPLFLSGPSSDYDPLSSN